MQVNASRQVYLDAVDLKKETPHYKGTVTKIKSILG